MRDGQLRRTQPKAVPPLREKMKLHRYLRILENLKVDKGVLDVGSVIILGLKQKRRRSLRVGLKGGVHLAVRAAEPPRVENHLEVGPGFDSGCGNILTLKVGMSAEDRSKMSSSGEANNADAVRIDVPLRGVSSGQAHGLLRVFQIFDIFRIVTFFRDAILHQNASHAKRVEPAADLRSFKVVGKPDITSAWKDERGSAAGLCRIGRIDGKLRFTNVCNANGQFAGDDSVSIRSRIDLRPNHLRGLGVAVGPEQQRLLLGQTGDGK